MSEKKSSGFVANFFGRSSQPLPGTTVTKEELAEAIGEAIQKSFKEHIPQPADMASAIKEAVQEASKQTAGELEQLQAGFIKNQSSLLEKWSKTESQAASKLEEAQKALDALSKNIGGSIEKAVEKLGETIKAETKGLSGALGDVGKEVQKSTQGDTAKISAALKQHTDQVAGVLNDHVDKLKSSMETLAGQLTKIADLEKEIKEVLHIQEVVDGTLKTISAAEEFKQSFTALQKHLEASDELLREAAKPRTITLVETEPEVPAG